MTERQNRDTPVAIVVPVMEDTEENNFRRTELELEIVHLSGTVKRLSYLTWLNIVMVMPVLGWSMYQMLLVGSPSC